MVKKAAVSLLQNLDHLSAISMRLVKLTGKHKEALHPKHLISQEVWYQDYLQKTDTVLDLGSGSGQATIKISGKVKKVTGADIEKKSIEAARKEATIKEIENVSFLVLDANKKLPFKNGFFDKIICSDVLEHLNKRDFAVSEIKRVLKTGGLLFLVTDNPNTSWKRLQESVGLFYYADRDHKYEYSKDEILTKLKSKNFRIISIDTITYDTPLRGLIDLTGGVSLGLYKKLVKWRRSMVQKHPEETVGYRIIAQKP